jgi:hypothetical protein
MCFALTFFLLFATTAGALETYIIQSAVRSLALHESRFYITRETIFRRQSVACVAR